jgi:hypothetical protein
MKGRWWKPSADHLSPLGKPSVLGPESLWLILLSAGDLFVTYALVWEERFYESNPFARWFYERWNIAGMTAFKFGLVALIVVLGETIERHRPKVGRAILILGCITAAAVMVHGLRMLMGD